MKRFVLFAAASSLAIAAIAAATGVQPLPDTCEPPTTTAMPPPCRDDHRPRPLPLVEPGALSPESPAEAGGDRLPPGAITGGGTSRSPTSQDAPTHPQQEPARAIRRIAWRQLR